jgi:hypothetical protein
MSADIRFAPPSLLAMTFEGQLADLTEEFRANAAECQELANRWADEGKRQYEELAHQWLELAEQISDRRRSAGPQAVLAHR